MIYQKRREQFLMNKQLEEKSKIPGSTYRPSSPQIELIWQQSEWLMGHSFREQTLANYWFTSMEMAKILASVTTWWTVIEDG